MTPDLHPDLIGWWDTRLRRTYSLGEAEHIFGARLYHHTPPHLFPLFASPGRAARYGALTQGDKWIERFKRWRHVEPVTPTAGCNLTGD